MLNDDIMKLRLESLKMAYETIFKIGSIKESYTKEGDQIKDDIKDVFSLADMNLEYLINGLHPYDEEE